METSQLTTSQNPINIEHQTQQARFKNNLFVAISISVLLTVITSGTAVYFWQRSSNDKTINDMEQKIASLEKQISTIDKIKVTPQPTSLPDLPTPTPTTAFARDILVDYSGIDPNITPEIKQAIKIIIKSEKHVFTNRDFFTFSVYQNFNDKWIDAGISAPQSQIFITLQGEPYSRILLRKTTNGWVGHLGCAPGYLQLLVDFFQSDYTEASPELINTINLRLRKNPNATDFGCEN